MEGAAITWNALVWDLEDVDQGRQNVRLEKHESIDLGMLLGTQD